MSRAHKDRWSDHTMPVFVIDLLLATIAGLIVTATYFLWGV